MPIQFRAQFVVLLPDRSPFEERITSRDHGLARSALRFEGGRDSVGGADDSRTSFALWGYLGFLDDACLRWVHAGCPDDQRHSLVDAALGCLEGALGDWRK